MVVSKNGIVIRTPVTDIPNISRNTQGVRIMRLKEGDKVSTVEKIKHSNPNGGENNNTESFDSKPYFSRCWKSPFYFILAHLFHHWSFCHTNN